MQMRTSTNPARSDPVRGRYQRAASGTACCSSAPEAAAGKRSPPASRHTATKDTAPDNQLHPARDHTRFLLLVRQVVQTHRSAVNFLQDGLVFASRDTLSLILCASLAQKAYRRIASSRAQRRLPLLEHGHRCDSKRSSR